MADFNEKSQNAKNPFKLPTDEEVFLTREAQQQQKQDQKEQLKSQKIWEKHTVTTGRQLQRPKESDFNVESVSDSNHLSLFHPSKRNIVSEALDVVSKRNKSQAHKPSENLRGYIEDKKEIFRVEMKYRILKEEKEKISKRISKKEAAFKKSEEKLEEDQKRMIDNMEETKLQKDEAVNQMNLEITAKKEKEGEIKTLEQRKAAISSDINKNKETLEGLLKLKQFLDEKTPPDELQRREEEYQANYVRKRQEWIALQSIDESIDSQREDNESQLSATQIFQLQQQRRGKLEDKFAQLVAQGDIYVEEPEMYFKHPEQLTTILKHLEDESLFLIQQLQEKDNELEINRSSFNHIRNAYETKCEEMRRNKESLEQNIRAMDVKLNALNKKKQLLDTVKETTKSTNTLEEDIMKCRGEIGFDVDPGLHSRQMLEDIEGKINDTFAALRLLRQHNEKFIAEKEQEKESVRRDIGRLMNDELDEKRIQENIEKAQKRAQGPSFKKVGRKQMKKEQIIKEKKKKVVKKVQKTEEELIQEFIEETT